MRPLSHRIRNIVPSGIRRHFDAKREGLISLGGGTIDWDTLDFVHEAAIQAIRDDFTAYTTNNGIIELREAISEKMQRENGLRYSVDEILVVSGTSQAFGAIPMAVMEPGDEALILDPTYSAYQPVVDLALGVPVWVPTTPERGWNPDLDDLESRITDRTRLLFLNLPCVPTGAVLAEDIMHGIAEIAVKHDLYVCSDELYERLMFDGRKIISPASLPGMWERTFTVQGFSKGYGMTGWRVGYVAAPKVLIDALVKAVQYTSICAPSISQKAAVAALQGPQAVYDRLLAELDARRHLVCDSLNRVEGVKAEPQMGGFYTFVDMRQWLATKGDAMRARLRTVPDYAMPEEPDVQLVDYLHGFGNVTLGAGSVFGPHGRGFLRLSQAGTQPVLAKGLAQMIAALEQV
jgi:aspartate/methionine/tyrosine aminotransferase